MTTGYIDGLSALKRLTTEQITNASPPYPADLCRRMSGFWLRNGDRFPEVPGLAAELAALWEAEAARRETPAERPSDNEAPGYA